ncbi:MAG: hypothetical protein ABI420_13770 [Opitutaceae bacterium]
MLTGLAVFFLAVSWRKWPDPLIDFGRELYLPWRIANGAVLYRDVDDFYGPLSQYFNAGLFKLFGPGMMVLVMANLAIFAGVVVMLYRLFRRAWGPGVAFVAMAMFISVFGFSQSVGIGNYNYATPYAHEVTHGLLVCLLLVSLLPAWVEQATTRRSFVVGALFGLSAVLKPEMVLAAGLITAVAFMVQRWWRRTLTPAAMAAWLLGAILPTAAFASYFSVYVPTGTAWRWACRAWLNAVTSTRFTGDPVQRGFLGFDQPGLHLLQHVGATLIAIALIAAIALAIWLVNWTKTDGPRYTLAGIVAVGMGALACWGINWNAAGRCLLGMALIYGVISAMKVGRAPRTDATPLRLILRLLLAVLAAALMSRMLLNGRIYQFGFYQAALAALLVPAVLIGELPGRFGASRWGRVMAVIGCVALIGPGVGILAGRSRQLLRLKIHPVGEGRDRFFTFTPDVDPTGVFIGQASAWLRTNAGGPPQTLLVLPEGEMVNYLARLPSPVAPFFFYSAATSGGREAGIVVQLGKNPPDWIVLVNRDLREYGIQRYGESAEQGGQILDWAGDRYEVATAFGGDPLDIRQRGLMILKRRR